MSDPAVASDPDKFQTVAKQASKLEGIVEKYNDYKSTIEALHDTRAMLKESEEDEDMAEMVRAEIEELEEKVGVRSLCRCGPASYLARDGSMWAMTWPHSPLLQCDWCILSQRLLMRHWHDRGERCRELLWRPGQWRVRPPARAMHSRIRARAEARN
jgi:PCRF domain